MNFVNRAFAADAGSVPFPASSALGTITELLDRILNILLLFGGVAVVALIGYAALLFMTSGGDPSRVERARAMLKWTVVGYAIIVSAWLIITVVAGFFGVDIEKPS